VTAVGATAVLKTSDGYVYQLSGSEASSSLSATLVAAAASAAEDGDALAAAITAAAGGNISPGYIPGKGGASSHTSSSTSSSGVVADMLTAALIARMTEPGGRRRLSHIIGEDSRRERADYPGFPYTAVGQLTYVKGSCTGVMIGPRSVLTAGHCVYSRKRKAWQVKIQFTPYRHRVDGVDTWPVGRVPFVHATTYQGFLESSEYTSALNYDLAVVQLAEDIGERWPEGRQGSV